MQPKIRILSIDSGGNGGVITARIIQEIEKKAGKHISEIFDYMVGISAGAVIVGYINAAKEPNVPKFKTENLVNFYIESLKEIMESSFSHKIKSGFGIWGALYERSTLDKKLKYSFEDIKLSDTLKPLITYSFSLDKNELRTWSTDKANNEPNENFFIRDAIGASVSAPSIFAPKRTISTNGEELIDVDAGIIRVNPSLLAITTLKESNQNLTNDDFIVVSIGGRIPPHANFSEMYNYGLTGWINSSKVNILEIMLHQDYVATNNIASSILPKYYRFQVDPDTGPVGVFNVKDNILKQLISDTEQYLKDQETQDKLNQVISELSINYENSEEVTTQILNDYTDIPLHGEMALLREGYFCHHEAS
jgi:patatin-like phospholipase/acyl hydrolase